jgi:hypothetical protein
MTATATVVDHSNDDDDDCVRGSRKAALSLLKHNDPPLDGRRLQQAARLPVGRRC